MRSSQRATVVLVLTIAGITAGLLWLRISYMPGNLPQSGQRLPSLTFIALEGRQVGFDHYLGRKLLAVFVDPECGYCQDQYQVLRDFHAGAGTYGLEVVVIVRQGFIDGPPPALPFPIWLDPDRQLRRKLGTLGVPALFLLDEEGILRSRLAGYQALDDIVWLVANLNRPQPVLTSKGR